MKSIPWSRNSKRRPVKVTRKSKTFRKDDSHDKIIEWVKDQLFAEPGTATHLIQVTTTQEINDTNAEE